MIVFGSRGFLGKNIKEYFSCESYDADLRDAVDLFVRDEVIVLCAINKAESREAYNTNIQIINNVISYCKDNNCSLIFFEALCYNKKRKYYIKAKKKQLKILKKSGIKNYVIQVGCIIEDPRNIIQKILNGQADEIYTNTKITFSKLETILNKINIVLNRTKQLA